MNYYKVNIMSIQIKKLDPRSLLDPLLVPTPNQG